jgi:hypothetical protein
MDIKPCSRITNAVRARSGTPLNFTVPISVIIWVGIPEPMRCRGLALVRKLVTAGMFVAMAGFATCAPPTEVIDLSMTPQATLDAMAHIPIVPLGSPGRFGAISVGIILGYGCSRTASGAADAAVHQLQIKALNMQAVAVVDVLVTPADSGPCLLGYRATASGTARAATSPPGT